MYLSNINHILAQLGINKLIPVFKYLSQLLAIKIHKNIFHTEPPLTVVLVVNHFMGVSFKMTVYSKTLFGKKSHFYL